MNKLRLLKLEDLKNNNLTQISLNESNYLVAKVDEEVFVTSDMCTHEDAELSMGYLDGKKVKCPLHGSFFDLVTGKALNEPATDPIKVYEVIIEKGVIYIND